MSQKSKSRSTLLKRIKAQANIYRKLDIARGFSDASTVGRELKSSEDILGVIDYAKWVVKKLLELEDDSTDEQANQTGIHVTKLGLIFLSAIADNNYKAFAQISAALQYSRKPDRHKLYTDILAFCEWHSCGTNKNPCSAMELVKYLKKRRHILSVNHDNEIPSSLRRLCKKMGVELSRKKNQ